MFSQSSHVGGVGSGAGALRYGAATNQTGNLLNTDTHIEGPRILVGKSDHPGGARKKRFGVTGSASVFDYPDLMVRGNGPTAKHTSNLCLDICQEMDRMALPAMEPEIPTTSRLQKPQI